MNTTTTTLTTEQKALNEEWMVLLAELQRSVTEQLGILALPNATVAELAGISADDNVARLRSRFGDVLVELEEAMYEATEQAGIPPFTQSAVPQYPAHVNPDPASQYSAEAAGLRIVEAPAVRKDSVNHSGYWGLKRRRHPNEVSMVAIHVTGVGDETHGFGTRAEHRAMFPDDMLRARGERYQALEYHTIFSWTDRGHWRNLPLWAHSYASTSLNPSSVAWVFDGQWPDDRAVDDAIVDATIGSLMQALEDLWEWRCSWDDIRGNWPAAEQRKAVQLDAEVTLAAHRQGDEDRGADPGAQLWTRVVLVVVTMWNSLYGASRFRVKVDPGLVLGKGRELPSRWANWTPA